MNIKITALTVASLLAVSNVVYAAELYVSPAGQDSNSGAKDAPLASLAAARDALRASGSLGRKPCEVIIGAGIYRFVEPLTLSPADSGSANFPVVYRAAGSEEVIFTGAQEINSSWEVWRDGIVRARVGESSAIDQLFVNGERQTMARYPNLGAGFVPAGKDQSVRGKKAGNVPYGGSSPNAWDRELSKDWKDPAGAFMHGMHSGLWGSQHYRVLGKNADGSLDYEGGWQNNRLFPPHQGYRMIENVFEELDAPGEWFHDVQSGWLYVQPADGMNLKNARVEVVRQLRHLIECYGTAKQPIASMELNQTGNGMKDMTVQTVETVLPVKHIRFEGIQFAGTARTFMETREPLLRSDWCIYRGGAVHLRGTEFVSIEKCRFEELGGNAVFVDGYNRHVLIRGNRFHENGASDVNFVGSFAAVRDPAFSYGTPARPIHEIDSRVGPKSNEYPADCRVEDNLMTRCGRFEKQVAGVNISMSSRITVRHNTISHTPRAAINICDGTWGGHRIEWNDCFETVLETHDHGAFNAWGRDRIWHSASPAGPTARDETGKALISDYIEKFPDSPRWDAYQTTIIRHNRMQCDHGWDIDLDDGCTNYEIYNNLCLKGGLKTREGYTRTVTNNVILGNYTCNVPYPKPTFDVFERNIIWGKRIYNSSNPILWGGTRNHTFVHNPDAAKTEPAVGLQQETMDDADSLYGKARFVDPKAGNFQVLEDSPALKTGFRNFAMTGFGVTSAALRADAQTPKIELPAEAALNGFIKPKAATVLGAQVKTLDTDAEMSATGMHERMGAYLVEVPAGSALRDYGFKSGDVVWMLDRKLTPGIRDFSTTMSKLKKGRQVKAKVWRAQEWKTFTFTR